MRISSKGQVTIPIAIRENVGFLPNTEVDFVQEGDSVRIVRATGKGKAETRGERAVRLLRGSAGKIGMTTEEIMALTRGEE